MSSGMRFGIPMVGLVIPVLFGGSPGSPLENHVGNGRVNRHKTSTLLRYSMVWWVTGSPKMSAKTERSKLRQSLMTRKICRPLMDDQWFVGENLSRALASSRLEILTNKSLFCLQTSGREERGGLCGRGCLDVFGWHLQEVGVWRMFNQV